MAFRFNFANPSQEENGTHADDSETELNSDEKRTNVADFCEIILTENKQISKEGDQQNTKTYKCSDDVSIRCYDNNVIVNKLVELKGDNSSVVKADAVHSDLIPDVYEGGLTVWECGLDLAEYMATEKIDFKGKCVLELGCGAGIPGICAMKLGAKEVHFQDYNGDVLEMYTIPNVQSLNASTTCTCRFFSGDWSNFCACMKPQLDVRYDVIITAETIYSPSNYKHLHKLFHSLLKPKGRIYLAAKSIYFGVGGGTQLFKDFVDKEGIFTTEVVKDISEGIPREIMLLEWRENT